MMKECPFCRERYADAQELCPSCGRKPGDPVGELRRSEDKSLDEGFGPQRRRQFIIAITVVEFLFIAAAVIWFLK